MLFKSRHGPLSAVVLHCRGRETSPKLDAFCPGPAQRSAARPPLRCGGGGGGSASGGRSLGASLRDSQSQSTLLASTRCRRRAPELDKNLTHAQLGRAAPAAPLQPIKHCSSYPEHNAARAGALRQPAGGRSCRPAAAALRSPASGPAAAAGGAATTMLEVSAAMRACSRRLARPLPRPSH